MRRLLIAPFLLLSSLAMTSQTPSLLGSWRADTPLSNGIVQTFSFDGTGKFDLAMALVVDAHYTASSSRLIETVTLPDGARSDTSSIRIAGDSLIVTDRASTTKTLRRVSGTAIPGSIVGEWRIALANGASANYEFSPDGGMHVRAVVREEKGTYSITGDTLRLSHDGMFQLPATSIFSVNGPTLTLTPPDGSARRTFHRIS